MVGNLSQNDPRQTMLGISLCPRGVTYDIAMGVCV